MKGAVIAAPLMMVPNVIPVIVVFVGADRLDSSLPTSKKAASRPRMRP